LKNKTWLAVPFDMDNLRTARTRHADS